jgi:hypothetical protein
MSNDTPKPTRPRLRLVSADGRHGRQLELVTDGWVAELADLVMLRALPGGGTDSPRATIVRAIDRDPRPGSDPLSPA